MRFDPCDLFMSAFACVSIGFRFGRPAAAAARIKALAAAGAGPVLLWIGSCPVFKAPAVVSGFEDVAVMRQAIEQCCCILASPNTLDKLCMQPLGGAFVFTRLHCIRSQPPGQFIRKG